MSLFDMFRSHNETRSYSSYTNDDEARMELARDAGREAIKSGDIDSMLDAADYQASHSSSGDSPSDDDLREIESSSDSSDSSDSSSSDDSSSSSDDSSSSWW
jgi:hypothetical protein